MKTETSSRRMLIWLMTAILLAAGSLACNKGKNSAQESELFAKVEQLNKEFDRFRDAGNYESALDKLKAALAIWEQLPGTEEAQAACRNEIQAIERVIEAKKKLDGATARQAQRSKVTAEGMGHTRTSPNVKVESPTQDPRVLKWLEQAKAKVEAVTETEEKVTVYEYIAKCQSKAGDISGAGETLRLAKTAAASIKDKDDRVRMQYGLAATQAELGNIRAAQDTIKEAGEASGSARELDGARAFRAIAVTQAQEGDIDAAERTIGDIEWPLCKAEAYCAVSAAHAKAGRWGDAQTALARAKSAAAAEPALSNKLSAYRDIAVATAHAGRPEVDYEVAKQMFKAIEYLISKMEYAEEKPQEYRSLAESQARAGYIAEAKATADTLNDHPYDKSVAYRAIALTQLRAKDLTGARESLNQATAAAARFEDKFDQVQEYGMIAALRADADDATAGRQTLQEAKTILATLADDGSKGKTGTLPAIAAAQARLGDIDGLESLKNLVNHPSAQIAVYLGAAMGATGLIYELD